MGNSTVAIIGRPNVGKSTLFNRLLSQERAMVHPEPGTTRDRLTGTFRRGREGWTLVDTGGIVAGERSLLAEQIQRQVERAIHESQLILFVVDLQSGLLPQDERVAELLRRASRPVLLVANKADRSRLQGASFEFYRLGLGDPC